VCRDHLPFESAVKLPMQAISARTVAVATARPSHCSIEAERSRTSKARSKGGSKRLDSRRLVRSWRSTYRRQRSGKASYEWRVTRPELTCQNRLRSVNDACGRITHLEDTLGR
jgi:hypothetical protein